VVAGGRIRYNPAHSEERCNDRPKFRRGGRQARKFKRRSQYRG